jgi:hypothetical protein
MNWLKGDKVKARVDWNEYSGPINNTLRDELFQQLHDALMMGTTWPDRLKFMGQSI